MLKPRIFALFSVLALSACQAPLHAPIATEATRKALRQVQALPQAPWVMQLSSGGVSFSGEGTATQLGWSGGFYRVSYTPPAKTGLVITSVNQKLATTTLDTVEAVKINGVPLGGPASNDGGDPVRYWNFLFSGHVNYIIGAGKTTIFSFSPGSTAQYYGTLAYAQGSTSLTGYTVDLTATSSGGILGVK